MVSQRSLTRHRAEVVLDLLIGQGEKVNGAIQMELLLAVLILGQATADHEMRRLVVVLELVDGPYAWFLVRRLDLVEAIEERQQASLLEPPSPDVCAHAVLRMELTREPAGQGPTVILPGGQAQQDRDRLIGVRSRAVDEIPRQVQERRRLARTRRAEDQELARDGLLVEDVDHLRVWRHAEIRGGRRA